MNLRNLIAALVVVFTTCISSHAVDTLRYALIAQSSAIEAPKTSLLELSATGEVNYILNTEEVTFGAKITTQDESLINWTPMSIESLGYDIREVWRMECERVYSYSLAFSR